MFHCISRECFRWLEAQPNVKEESLTDWLLYAASRITDRVYYKTFTRNEEASIGADWEWWVLTSEKGSIYAYRFLIQAKKLKSGGDNYSLVGYCNRNGMQIDLLLDAAERRGAMPLYLYYSCSSPQLPEQIKNFHFIDPHIVSWCEKCVNGAYLSMAHRVKEQVFDQPRKKLSDEDLLNDSLGLSICDWLWRPTVKPYDHLRSDRPENGSAFQNSPAAWVLSAVNCFYLEHKCAQRKQNESGIKYAWKNIPPYLKTLVERHGEELDWFEPEFGGHSGQFEGLLGTAVFDFTDHYEEDLIG